MNISLDVDNRGKIDITLLDKVNQKGQINLTSVVKRLEEYSRLHRASAYVSVHVSVDYKPAL